MIPVILDGSATVAGICGWLLIDYVAPKWTANSTIIELTHHSLMALQ